MQRQGSNTSSSRVLEDLGWECKDKTFMLQVVAAWLQEMEE